MRGSRNFPLRAIVLRSAEQYKGGFRPGRQYTLFINKINIDRNIMKVLPPTDRKRDAKTAAPAA